MHEEKKNVKPIATICRYIFLWHHFLKNVKNRICPSPNAIGLVNTTSALLINLKTIMMGEADFAALPAILNAPRHF